jgi:hypothetical protein
MARIGVMPAALLQQVVHVSSFMLSFKRANDQNMQLPL